MAEKVTIMILKVNLQYEKCYKKVKKVLCKFPQIRDQVYDEKKNIVIIKVVCCSPEKIRDKLCCKGCGAIKSIEIVEPPQPLPPPPPPPAPPPPPPSPRGQSDKPRKPPEVNEKPPAESAPPKSLEPAPPPVVPILGIPPPAPVPIGTCCVPCYEGRPGGPCFEGFRGPPPCYGYYYGRPVYDSYGGGRPCYVSRCDQYFNEDNATECTIM